MSTCIYCLKTKPATEFSKEHVLSRAFCGQGKNWSLDSMVCADCNNFLSRFESHWTRSAIEGMMRAFSGPVGRPRNMVSNRQHPVDMDHVYLVTNDGPWVYEAGFSFPYTQYFRSQVLHTEKGLVALVSREEDKKIFEESIYFLKSLKEIELTQVMENEKTRQFRITSLRLSDDRKHYSIVNERVSSTPGKYWVRSYPDLDSNRLEQIGEISMTPRVSLDDRGRLYFRASSIDEIVSLLGDLQEGRAAPGVEGEVQRFEGGEQVLFLGMQIRLPAVFRSVLKTGFNLVAVTAGSELARKSIFDDLRRILFDVEADDEVIRRCNIVDGSVEVDQSLGKAVPSQHRLMFYIHKSCLRFRMRLYGHMGYECTLARVGRNNLDLFETTRVVVDFEDSGMRSVEYWPE